MRLFFWRHADKRADDRAVVRVEIGRVEEFPEGRGTPVAVAGRALAAFRIGEQVFVLDDRCPHRGFPLHDGICDGATVRCRTHGATFALAGGTLVRGPARRGVRAYAARVEDGRVFVDLPA